MALNEYRSEALNLLSVVIVCRASQQALRAACDTSEKQVTFALLPAVLNVPQRAVDSLQTVFWRIKPDLSKS
jgi:hypothetical protein